MAQNASFDWASPLLLDQQLTEDERMVRQTAEQYAQNKLRRVSWKPSAMRRPTRKSSAKWASWACSAPPSRKPTAAPA